MTSTLYLTLEAGGELIAGGSTAPGHEGDIECLAYAQKGQLARSGRGITRRYDPLVITKHIDRASPLLLEAFIRQLAITATFHFYRPNPSGDGTQEQFYSVEIRNGRIRSMEQKLLNTLDLDTVSMPPLEEVTFAFPTISWTYLDGALIASDDLRSTRGG